MSLNPTVNYLRQRRHCIMMNFVDAVGTTDRYLKGPGGYAGDGYPMPAPGKILRFNVWDGYNLITSTTETSFDAGDRISVIAQYDSPWFMVTVRINGGNTNTYCTQVAANTTLRTSLLVRLDVY